MKDAKAPQEDVTGLFRKFGGDAAAYKEFAPADIPAATRPIAPVPAPSPALHALAPTPATGVTSPVAAKEAPVVPSAPRELDRLFARLDACTPIPARMAPGLTAHWRKPG